MSFRISFPRPIVFVLILYSVGARAGAQPDNPQNRRVAEAVRPLKERDPSARHRGPRKLDRLSSQAALAVPALVTCLSDPDSTIRKEAANVLRRIGPAARS
ncbi:MAG: armadillo/beta-catenin-like repeat-containing protein, partial [Isosphaeraceae bacterium]